MPTLLDLPDHCLCECLKLLPTARDLLKALESCQALRSAGSTDPMVWEPLSSTYTWLIRRRPAESFAKYFQRAATSSKYLMAFGGDRGSMWPTTADIPAGNILDLSDMHWLSTPTPETSIWRNAPALACDGGTVYAIGGWDDDDDEPLASIEAIRVPQAPPKGARSTLTRFSSQSTKAVDTRNEDLGDTLVGGDAPPHEWSDTPGWTSPLPDLPEPRCFAAATFDGAGRLWVAGGGDAMSRGAACLTSVVYLDVRARGIRTDSGDGSSSASASASASGGGATSGGADAANADEGLEGEWVAAGDMLEPRCGLALAGDGRTSTLYCCGGYSGGLLYQQTVERFDMLGVQRPTMLPLMATPRSGCGAGVGPDGALYVVGGSDNGSSMLASCERFDPREGCWRALPDMPTPRGYLSAAFASDGCLYVAGGCGGPGFDSEPVPTLEALDVRAGKWRTGLESMPHARSNHAIVLALGC